MGERARGREREGIKTHRKPPATAKGQKVIFRVSSFSLLIKKVHTLTHKHTHRHTGGMQAEFACEQYGRLCSSQACLFSSLRCSWRARNLRKGPVMTDGELARKSITNISMANRKGEIDCL